jgi:hypothetical protein
MRNQNSGFSWTFEKTFHFESNGTLDEVAQALAKEDGGLFRDVDDQMLIERLNDSYMFRYEVRRRSHSQLQTTAFGEGEVWQDERGVVVVEGEAKINVTLQASATAGLFALILVILGMGIVGVLGFLFFSLAFLSFTIYLSFEDRNRVVECISSAVDSTVSQFNTLPASDSIASQQMDSIWNNAVSEYDDREIRSVSHE